LAHQGDPFVVEQRPVLDRPHAGAHGLLDPVRAVRVGGHVAAVPGRFLHSGAHLCFAVLRDPRVRPRGEHGAGCDELDEIGAAAEQLPHPLAHLVGRVGDTEAQVAREDDVRSDSGDLSAAARYRDVGAGHSHAGTQDGSVIDRGA
jgi:hypothetical protein